jgi:hypothetical protein
MSAAAIADFGIKAIMGLSAGITEQGQVDANNIVSAANAWASNLVRAANNTAKGSRASLQRFNQSVNNQRALDNMGSSMEAAAVNYRRARDSRTNDNFEKQIAYSEQAGAQAAASALSGLTGGVADLVAGTTALRKSRLQQRFNDATKQGDYDAAQRQQQIFQAGWDSLDSSEIAADLDYSIDVAQTQRRAGGFISDVMGQQDAKNMASAAATAGSWFKSLGSSTEQIGSTIEYA